MRYDLPTFRGDLAGGLTSTVVTLPFALAFGVASGLGAAAGMYAAIAVGFFATVFGGSRTVISGPGPDMTIAMAIIVTAHATTLSEAFTVVVMAGVLQILLGLSGLGRFLAYTPHLVMSGIRSGIGLVIVLIQIGPFLGASGVAGGAIASLEALPQSFANAELDAVWIAVVALGILLLWPARVDRWLPSPVITLVVGTLLGVLWLTDAPIIGTMPTGLPELHLTVPSLGFVIASIQPALILALLSSITSLFACTISDSLTGSQHNANRELVGQGLGNMAAGIVGALPGSGAPVSTAASIGAGASTRVAGVLRSILLLSLLMGLVGLAEPIPLAVLAVILIKLGWELVDWDLLRRVHLLRREHLIVLLTTMGLTVFVDLITAGAIGLILAGMAHARQLERFELDSVVSVPLSDQMLFEITEGPGEADPFEARVGLVMLKGGFTVASSKKLVDVIGGDIKDHEVVIFDLTATTYLDDSAAHLIGELLDIATSQDTAFVFAGLSEDVEKTLFAFGVLRRVPEDRLVSTLESAQQLARELLPVEA